MPPAVESGHCTINYAAEKSFNIGRLLRDSREYVKVRRTMAQKGLFTRMKSVLKFTGNMTVKKEIDRWWSGKVHLWRQVGKDLRINMKLMNKI